MRDNEDVRPPGAGTDTVANDPRSESSLSESLLDAVWQSRWLILLTIVLCLGAAAIYLHEATPIYKSESKLYVEQTGPRIIREMEEGVMTR